MKAALFSMYDRYGAGAAAYRLHEALCEKGFSSSFFVGEKTREQSIALGVPATGYQLVQEIWQKTAFGDTFSALQFGISTKVLDEAVSNADIINIHWASNFISLDNVAWLISRGKRVVITMHDENLYTGGCHYRHGCERYLHICEDCPQMPGIPGLASDILAGKKARLPVDAVIVTPSQWLASLAALSPVLSHNRIEVIPNGIDPRVFGSSLRESARKRHGYDDSRFVVLFGSQFLKDERKGVKYLLEAMERLKNDEVYPQLDFACFGSDDTGLPPYIRSFGYIDGEREMAELFAMADVVIVPSLEDNLPNTMLESLMSGTPVIGCSIGGIPDAVIDKRNGLLVPPRDSIALADAVKTIVRTGRQMRAFCREDAVNRFGMAAMAERYIDLYQSIDPPAFVKSSAADYDIWLRAIQAEAEDHIRNENRAAELSLWLENERKYARLYESVYRIIAGKSRSRPVAIYGYGAWGRHIEDVAGDLITYIVDRNTVDSVKYCAPSRLAELKEENAFVLITVTNDQELTANAVKAGFHHKEDYICINDL